VPTPFENRILKNTIGVRRLSAIAILEIGLRFSVYTSASLYRGGDFVGSIG
jgi:hypothetical protein